MSHDRDAIRSAHDHGLFDDSFDPMALGLSEEEKARMADELGAAGEDLSAPENTPLPSRPGNAAKKKKKAKKLPFWQRILRFFLMLITGKRGPEYDKYLKLRENRRELKKVKPPLYNFKTNSITASLAHQTHALYEQLIAYHSIFKTIFEVQEESSMQMDFQFFFLRIAAPQNPRLEMIDQFSEQAIGELVEKEKESNVKKQLDETTQKFLASFDDEEKKQIDRVFAEMINFRDLLEFDYTSFLRRFNHDYNPMQDVKPVFKDVRHEGMSRLIQDLECTLLQVNTRFLPQVLEAARHFYREDIYPGMDPEEGQRLLALLDNMAQDQYRPILSAIGRLLQEGKLTLLVRHIEKDPGYDARVFQRRTNFFSEFVRNLASTVEKRIKEQFKHKIRISIQKKIKDLFGMTEIPSRYIYSEETNRALKQFELPQFLYAQPLNFCMLFFKQKYYNYLKRVLNKLLVDGSFKNSLTRRMISDEFYRIDDIHNEFLEFIPLVSEKQEKGGMLATMIRNFNGDLPSKKALTARINTLNQQIYPTLKAVRSSIHNLRIAVDQLEKDLGSRRPETIENLHKIGGSNNIKFLKEFKRAHSDLELFTDVLSQIFTEEAGGRPAVS